MGPVGIFGGTFDPIHHGHLRTALELSRRLTLEQVLFVPSARQPLRPPTVAPESARLAMVRAAVRDVACFAVDSRELSRPGPSYTVDTLAALRSEHPRRPLCLLLGMDAFLSLPHWHRWEALTGLAHIAVAHRPGWQPPGTGDLAGLLARCGTDNAADIREKPAGRILVTPVTQLEISASRIRESVAAGEDPRYLVPDPVREIIIDTECYADKSVRTANV